MAFGSLVYNIWVIAKLDEKLREKSKYVYLYVGTCVCTDVYGRTCV